MDDDDKRVNSMLARLDEFHAKFIKERKSLRLTLQAATAKNEEYEAKIKLIEAEKAALTDLIETLQAKLDGYFKDIDASSLPSVASVENNNADEISSSNEVIKNQHTESANSSQNTSGRLSADEQKTSQNTSTSEKNNDNNICDNQDVGISKQTQPNLDTVSGSASSTEIVTGTDGISSYFSNFYIDPQTINSDENLAASSIPIPPSIKMVLSSYERFDKRYLVFVTDEASTGSKDCHFLSIDDLLAIPENADLVQLLHEGQSTTPEGQNLTLFTVLGQLIARMSPAIPRSPGEKNSVETPALETQIKMEENSKVAKGTKRVPGPKKRKPNFVWVSENESDFEVEPLGSNIGVKESIRCRVCETVNQQKKYFRNRAALDQHIIQVHPLNAFPIYWRCPYGENECTRHYLQEKSLRKHIESCHPDANTSAVLQSVSKLQSWTCSYCDKEYLSSRIYLKHMKDIHAGSAETVELTESSNLRGRRKVIKTEPLNESTEKRNLRKRPNVSISRRSSLSSLDDEYEPDGVSVVPRKRGRPRGRASKSFKKENNPEPDQTNAVTIKAEIHSENVPTKHEPTSSQKVPSPKSIDRKDSTRVTPSTSTTDPTDVDEFVLSSVYEISSYFEKKSTAAICSSGYMDLPALDSPTEKVSLDVAQTSDRSQSSQYSAMRTLPCLLEDCPGCDYHPKPPVIGFTLDDEYVMSCREDILADLYSIPDNPPMVPGSFSATLYACVQIDTNDGEKRDAKNVANEPSSLVNGHDIANIIIANDERSQEIRDIANIPISDNVEPPGTSKENNLHSDQTDSDHLSLPDEQNRIVVDETLRTEDPTEHVTNGEKSVLEDCPVETNTIENQSKTVNGLDDNLVRQVSSPVRESHFADNDAVIEDRNETPVVDEEKSVQNDRPVETNMIENRSQTASGLDDNSICPDSSPIRNRLENNDAVIQDQNEIPVNEEQSVLGDDSLVEISMIENQSNTANGFDDNSACQNSSSIREDHFENSETVIEIHNETANNLDGDPACHDSSPIRENIENNETVIEIRDETANSLDGNSACHDSSPIRENIENNETVIEIQNETAKDLDDKPVCVDSSLICEDLSKMNESMIEKQNETTKDLDDNPVCDNSSPICEDRSKIEESVTEKQNKTACGLDDNSVSNDSFTIPEDRVENNETLSTAVDDHVCESNLDRNKITDEENQKENMTDIDQSATDESPSIPIDLSTSTKNSIKIDEKLPTDSTSREPDDRNQMENDTPSTSTPSTCQTNILVAEDQSKSPKSSNDDQIPNNPVPETISTTLDTSDNGAVTNNFMSTNLLLSTIKKRIQKSIFDPDTDEESNPATPNRDQIVDIEISTALENESNQPMNVEKETSIVEMEISTAFENDSNQPINGEKETKNGNVSNIHKTSSVNGENDLEPVQPIGVDNINEETESEANHDNNLPAIDPEHPQIDQNLPINGTSSPKSPPELEKMSDTVEIYEPHSSPTNIASGDIENRGTDPIDTSVSNSLLNQSTSSINSTFYDEYGLSSVCEIETLGEKGPADSKRNETTPILNSILSRSGSVRCTNKIIEGIGIEIEVEESSSTESSPRKFEDDDVSLFCTKKEFPNNYLTKNTPKQDNSVERNPHPVAESTPKPETPNKSSCLVLNQNPAFTDLVKRMLNDQNLGRNSKEIGKIVEIEINDSFVPRPLSPTSSHSTRLLNNIEEEIDSSGKLDDAEVEKDHFETDVVPVVESASLQILREKEKNDFENDIVPLPLIGSPPSSSPVETLPQIQDDMNQCSIIDTTETSPNQPEPFHHPANNSQRTGSNEENSSPLITSSNYVEPDSKSRDSNEKISDEDASPQYKLLDLTVFVPRLIIERDKPLSAKYYSKRGTRVSLEYLNSIQETKTKYRRFYRCMVCGEIFLKVKFLNTHLKEEHAGDDGTITCSLCDHVFQTKASLMCHRKSRHELLFADFSECRICERKVIYDTIEALNAHIFQSHPSPGPYYVRCPHGDGKCVWHFTGVEDYRDHVEIYHKNEDLSVPLSKIFPREMPWQCTLCNKVYSCDEYLSKHLITDHDQ